MRDEIYDLFEIEEELSIFHEGIFESIFLKMHSHTSNDKLVIGAVYLPDGVRSKKAQIFDIFEVISERVQRLKYDCIIVGDMNINMMKYKTDHTVGEYIDLQVSNGFKFRLAQPTRVTHGNATLIDHVMDNLINETKACGIITTQLRGSLGYTDHYPIYSIVQRTVSRPRSQPTVTRRKINAFTRRTFSENLKAADFTSAFHDDQAMSNMMTTVQVEYNKSFPLTTQKVKKYDVK